MSRQKKKAALEDKQLEFGFHAPEAAQEPVRRLQKAPDPGGGSAPCVASAAYAETRAEMLQRVADALHRELVTATGIDIRLRITNNTSTMMSLRYEAAGTRALVGLHHMFLEAPADIRKALTTWIVKPRAKAPGKKLEAYIAEQRHLIANRPARTAVLRTRGRHFDLAGLHELVNREYFHGKITTPITWGKMPTLRRRRSIRFGSFSPGENLIRIHPLLDQEFVPLYFVRYIVFHEMLHADMGIGESATGRRMIHPPEFRRRETACLDFERALAWMEDEKNLRRLLRAPRE